MKILKKDVKTKQLFTLIGQYGDSLLQFEFVRIISSTEIGGIHFISCELEAGRSFQVSTKETVFIQELE